MTRASSRGLLVVVVTILIALVSTPVASAEPTTPPPSGYHVLTAGQLPTTCTEADIAAGASAYSSTLGTYWSESSHRWMYAPWCYPLWGFMSGSASQIIEAGGTATMQLTWGNDMADWIKKGNASVAWTYPGTAQAGCTDHTTFCTVKMGDAGAPGAEWSWGEFYATAPGRVFILPPSYPNCQPDDPCLDTITHAWSWVGVRPADVAPTAAFDFTVDGGVVSFSEHSTDPRGGTLFHEWNFGDGKTGTGSNPSHTYTNPGTYDVTLKSTNTAGLSGSITKAVTVAGQPLAITKLQTDPVHPTPADPVVTATIEVSNSGADPVTAVHPTVTVTNDTYLALVPGQTVPTFDLPAGGSHSFQLRLKPKAIGTSFINVEASGTVGGATTSAPPAQLAVGVVGGISSTLKLREAHRGGDGGIAIFDATITNGTGEGIDSIDARLEALPDHDVTISPPDGLRPTLEDGGTMDVRYEVVLTTTDPVQFRFSVTGRTVGSGLTSGAPTQTVDLHLDGPIVLTATVDRTKAAVGRPRGGEVVHLTGTGFTDAKEVDFRSPGGGAADRPATGLDVRSDTEMTVTTPDVADLVSPDDRGVPAWASDLVVVADTGEDPPNDSTESAPFPFRFEGPYVIESFGTDSLAPTGDAQGIEDVIVIGRNLTGVDRVEFLGAAGAEPQVATDVTVESDTRLSLRTPNMTHFLTARPDGGLAVDSTFRAIDRGTSSPGSTPVRSNPSPFRFEGPVITSVTVLDAEDALLRGSARGGDKVIVKGDHLDRVDHVTFRPTDHDAVNASEITSLDDHTVTFRTPDMTKYLERQADGTMHRNVEFELAYLDDRTTPIHSNAKDFQFEGPVIESIDRTTGRASGGQTVVVTGRHLDDVARVRFQGANPAQAAAADWTIDGTTMDVVLPDVRAYLATGSDGRPHFASNLILGYEGFGSGAIRDVTSNPVPFRFDATVSTASTRAAAAGSHDLEVASAAGFGPGDYAEVGPGGVVRRVGSVTDPATGRRGARAALATLHFDAPLPAPVPAGTEVTNVDPPAGDRAAPTVAIAADGATYAAGADVAAAYSCTDGAGVGVEGCVGSVRAGDRLDTSTVGDHTLSVEGWDTNGNLTAERATYHVAVTGPTGGGTVTGTVPDAPAQPIPSATVPPATGPGGSGSAGPAPAPGGSDGGGSATEGTPGPGPVSSPAATIEPAGSSTGTATGGSAAPSAGGLARTGAGLLGPLLAALAAVLVGVGLLVSSRRRPTTGR